MISRIFRTLCTLFAEMALAAAAVAQEAPPAEAPTANTPAAQQATPEATQAPIALASNDAEIAGRLGGIFSNVGGLENVTVEVESGVVRLGGTTLTGEQSQRAKDIASRLVGVVEVDNRIATETDVERRVAPEIERLRGWAEQAVNFAPLVLVALVVFFAFWLVGRIVTRTLRPFRRLVPNRFVEDLIGQIVRAAFGLAGLIVAMNLLGMTALLTSVLGAAGVLGIAAGFALRDTLENYIASLLLSLRQPFGPGDHVSIAGQEGRVAVLNSRVTVLVTLSGTEVRIPNATVYKTVITNFSQLPERRFEFEVPIAASQSAGKALEVALTALREVEGVLDKPEPLALVDRLADQAAVLKVSGWVNQGQSDLAKVQSKAIRRVKAALAEAGIAMPVPVRELRMAQQELAESVTPLPAQEDERQDIGDTRPDTTIGEKARAVRARSEDDLLDPSKPREC